ncbi:MAG: ABC transporter substrate-binding protein [Acetobacteraceae bacterium]|nr:ABC transporter substrate-binding protein [Acetobacteraceae bacterium]
MIGSPLHRRTLLGAMGATAFAGPVRAAAPIRLGVLRTVSPAPFYIAHSRGFFAAQGLEVEFKFFQAAQPIAAAAVAGDIDVGLTALTGGFFALAGKGELQVIGGGLHETKGFNLTAVLVSRQAYDAGLITLDKLPGHSFGITQLGSSFHYMLGQLAAAKKFDIKSVTLRPLQQVQNMVAAVRSGQVDATMAIASMARPMEAAGEARIIGWVGDYVPYQITALFAAAPMIATRADDLQKFCRAYQAGVAAYRAAFLRFDAAGKPLYDAATDAAIADITKYVFTGDPAAASKIKAGIGWYDVGGALDVADVKAQLTWFAAEGLVKGPIDPDGIIDTRFLPIR